MWRCGIGKTSERLRTFSPHTGWTGRTVCRTRQRWIMMTWGCGSKQAALQGFPVNLFYGLINEEIMPQSPRFSLIALILGCYLAFNNSFGICINNVIQCLLLGEFSLNKLTSPKLFSDLILQHLENMFIAVSLGQ